MEQGGPSRQPASGVTLVTGASGFVGSHLARALLDGGATVRGLVRGSPGALPPGVAGVPGDLADTEAVRAALHGVDTVVHAAGLAHLRGPTRASDAFQRVNVGGTRLLLSESARAGVRQFVFLSSIAAVGPGNNGRVDDTTVPAPLTPYGASKLEAERLVAAAARQDGLQATVFRLPLVYGPGMKGNPLRLFDMVSSGLPIPLGSVANRRSLLYVGNLGAALLAVLAGPAPAAGSAATYLVADREVVSTPELVRHIAHALRRTARLVPFPVWLARLIGRVGDRLPLGLDSAGVAGLVDSLVLDTAALRRIGFEPPLTQAEGLACTAAWYRQRTREP